MTNVHLYGTVKVIKKDDSINIRKEMTMKEHTAIIFNEKAELMQGNRIKRMHVYSSHLNFLSV